MNSHRHGSNRCTRAAWWSSARDVEGRRGRFFGLKLYSRLAKGRCGETRRLVLRRVKFWRESTPARVESVVHRMIFIAGVRPAPLRERLSLGRIAVQHQRYKREHSHEMVGRNSVSRSYWCIPLIQDERESLKNGQSNSRCLIAVA